MASQRHASRSRSSLGSAVQPPGPPRASISFSLSRDDAGCFGDWLLGVRVPLVKLLLWPGLLDTASLDGESEVIALGGDYEVEAHYD